MIVIISTAEDAHLPFVIRHLPKDSYRLVDPVTLVQGRTLDYTFTDGDLGIVHDGQILDDVRAVWLRRPSNVKDLEVKTNPEYLAYIQSSVREHVQMMWYVWPDALWVSRWSHMLRAAVKPLQLQTAKRLGFNIPETIFATDPKQARNFVASHGTCIAKPQATFMPPATSVMAKVIHADDDWDYDGVRIDPYIFQQYIEPYIELRVTVVGDKLFAARITGRNLEASDPFRDWKYWNKNGTFGSEAYDLPPEIAQRCLRLVADYKLSFGAIDLIVDKDGTFWFLEINPNGQWAFIEETSGLPIGKAIANLLSNA